jgi:DNA-binding response OmpR family regulator
MSKKILIIDDSPTDAEIVTDLLSKENLEVSVALTAEDGIKKALEIKPDLIVLDLVLPDINGFDVCARLKKEACLSKTIIVILTIRDSIEDIKRAFNVEADDYIIKPPDPRFIVKKIKLYLGLR